MSQQTPPTSTEHLINQITTQRPEALSELYDRFSKLLYGFILAITHDTKDAEEILIDTFIRVWRSPYSCPRSHNDLKTWLLQLAYCRAAAVMAGRRQIVDRTMEGQTIMNSDG